MLRTIALLVCIFLTAAVSARAAAPPALPMQVTVHPNPMPAATTHAVIDVVTEPSIICIAFILFDNGLLPLTFQHARTEVTSTHGLATWAWSDPPRAAGGTASVSCTAGSVTRTVDVHFRVVPGDTVRRTSTPVPFSVRAAVIPNPLTAHDGAATLVATTATGARCIAGVFYNDGLAARTFVGYPQTATHNAVAWHWHMETTSTGGTATVTCTFQGKTGVSTVLFTIRRP